MTEPTSAFAIVSGPAVVDFGDVLGQRELTHRFVLENRSGVPVSVDRIVRSCTCTEVEFSNALVEPGARTPIVVRANVEGRTGAFEAALHVLGGPGPDALPVRLALRAQLGHRGNLRLEPPVGIWQRSEALSTRAFRLVLSGDAVRAPLPELPVPRSDAFLIAYGDDTDSFLAARTQSVEVLITPVPGGDHRRSEVLVFETNLGETRFSDRLALSLEPAQEEDRLPERMWLGCVTPGSTARSALLPPGALGPWNLVDPSPGVRLVEGHANDSPCIEVAVLESSGVFEVPVRLRRGEREHAVLLVGYAAAVVDGSSQSLRR